MSGIPASDECLAAFEALKTKKASRYLIFTIKDNKEIVVADKGAPEETYDQFLAKIEKDTPCYAIFDFEYDTEDGGKRGKIVFIAWVPDTSKVKAKMIYASTKDNLKRKIEGGLVEVQATDASELCYEAVLAKVKAGK
jgi:cofilin